MKIGIAGAGAVGCFFGGLLQKAGHSVTFLARGSHLTTMRKNGLTIHAEEDVFSIDGEFTDNPNDLSESDLILLCVKSTDTENVANQLTSIVKKNAIILTLQNGVDNEETLITIFGPDRVLSAATYVQTFIEAPGNVRQQGRVKLVIGELDKSLTEACVAIVDMFQKTGVDTKHSANILERKWHKLLWNTTFNPLSAVLTARVGQILEDEHLRKTAESICAEAVEVARKTGIAIDPGPTISKVFSNAERARDHQTSMLQDRLQGKRMEVEAMCGFIVKKGEDLQVPTPTLQTVYHILTFVDQQHNR